MADFAVTMTEIWMVSLVGVAMAPPLVRWTAADDLV